jgi:hypothetical protein
MIENDLISPYQDGSFRPDEPVSRAVFAALLYNTFNLEANNSLVEFEDLPITHWAYPYVQGSLPFLTYYEYETGLYYNPNGDTVREDLVIAMVIASGVGELYEPDYSVLKEFKDAEDISPELIDFVTLAVQTNLMSGSEGRFNPQKPLTRAEACTVLAKYLLDFSNDPP